VNDANPLQNSNIHDSSSNEQTTADTTNEDFRSKKSPFTKIPKPRNIPGERTEEVKDIASELKAKLNLNEETKDPPEISKIPNKRTRKTKPRKGKKTKSNDDSKTEEIRRLSRLGQKRSRKEMEEDN
jgi:hypothetical protein